MFSRIYQLLNFFPDKPQPAKILENNYIIENSIQYLTLKEFTALAPVNKTTSKIFSKLKNSSKFAENNKVEEKLASSIKANAKKLINLDLNPGDGGLTNDGIEAIYMLRNDEPIDIAHAASLLKQSYRMNLIRMNSASFEQEQSDCTKEISPLQYLTGLSTSIALAPTLLWCSLQNYWHSQSIKKTLGVLTNQIEIMKTVAKNQNDEKQVVGFRS